MQYLAVGNRTCELAVLLIAEYETVFIQESRVTRGSGAGLKKGDMKDDKKNDICQYTWQVASHTQAWRELEG